MTENKPVGILEIFGQLELEILRQKGQVYGFNLVAKETASTEAKKYCKDLASKWHSNEIKIDITDSFLMVRLYNDTLKNSLKFSLAARDARALGELLTKGFEVRSNHHQLDKSPYGIKVLTTGKIKK
jgi:hypothetical protein